MRGSHGLRGGRSSREIPPSLGVAKLALTRRPVGTTRRRPSSHHPQYSRMPPSTPDGVGNVRPSLPHIALAVRVRGCFSTRFPPCRFGPRRLAVSFVLHVGWRVFGLAPNPIARRNIIYYKSFRRNRLLAQFFETNGI